LSIACAWMGTGSGRGLPIPPAYDIGEWRFKYFVMQSHTAC
jgi:hypothetical protein